MQLAIEPLARDNISDTVASAVRDMIVDGKLAAGARINEVRLSQALGVSRTPLREALNRLSQEGALISTPRIGYSVRPLTLEEFDQIYDIRPMLDPEALRLAGLPSPEKLDRLNALNHRIESARKPDEAIALDDEWHFLLIGDCPNKVLLEMIAQVIRRTHRYEIALMRDNRNIRRAGLDHRGILAALRRRDLTAACAALKKNLQTGKAPIAAWLRERERKPA
ncbi:MAG TPA: GntR family transcriptional regulator [Rhizomicrobium sp.]|nr:GntR family transcriptional regulator [Rhizomicrobium sp.]